MDLIVIVPDGDMEAAIRALLARPKDLGIRPIVFDIRRHVQRDAGCRTDCHNYLRLWLRRSAYALVLFDHEGSGREERTREELESHVEGILQINGWQNRCAVIVIAPELEAWVWSDSPSVDDVLGWQKQVPNLREWIRSKTKFWTVGRPKPERPKKAMEAALYKARKQHSQVLYEDLAARVSVDHCANPSFGKFKDVLRMWFPFQQEK